MSIPFSSADKVVELEMVKPKSRAQYWWGLSSVAQLGWGITSFRKGCANESRIMPLKAFAVASLFVGALASASIASLHASGIHKVEDALEVGASIRRSLGVLKGHHRNE